MDRKQKIETLKGISEGKLGIESLTGPRIYFFDKVSKDPAKYIMDGKEFNQIEYEAFCNRVKGLNNNSIVWEEEKNYVITVEDQENRSPLLTDIK